MARSRLAVPLLATLAYMLLVGAVLVTPMSAPHPRGRYLAEFQLPLGRRVVADVAVNIAIFVPIGWGLHHAARRRGTSPRMPVLAVTLAAGLFSLLMETVQFWLPYRYSSVVDVGANTLGALLGAWGNGRSGSRA